MIGLGSDKKERASSQALHFLPSAPCLEWTYFPLWFSGINVWRRICTLLSAPLSRISVLERRSSHCLPGNFQSNEILQKMRWKHFFLTHCDIWPKLQEEPAASSCLHTLVKMKHFICWTFDFMRKIIFNWVSLLTAVKTTQSEWEVTSRLCKITNLYRVQNNNVLSKCAPLSTWGRYKITQIGKSVKYATYSPTGPMRQMFSATGAPIPHFFSFLLSHYV